MKLLMPERRGNQGMAWAELWFRMNIAVPVSRQMSRLTAGPAAVVKKLGQGRCGGSQEAKPPSGHMRMSWASPPTQRAAKQWPNSCSSTLMNRMLIAVRALHTQAATATGKSQLDGDKQHHRRVHAYADAEDGEQRQRSALKKPPQRAGGRGTTVSVVGSILPSHCKVLLIPGRASRFSGWACR